VFDADVRRAGERLAAYAAVGYALAEAKTLNLERAVDSSREIGAAIGILMSRQLVTREQAFALLRAASQRSHRKLRDLADDIIRIGRTTGQQR
jgi:AmiR/NasT family two-component response regulator